MQPELWKLRVSDILSAIDKILLYTDGMTFDAFAADNKTIDAVLWNLTVIGEAAGHVPSHVTDRYSHVPWRSMRAMRNFLVHEYVKVDLQTIWETVERRLPTLMPQLQEVLTGP